MPTFEPILRDYEYPDLIMLEKAQVFKDTFTVDKLSFTALFPGLADPFAANFQTDINAADAIPSDSEIVQQIAVFTEQIEAQMVLGRKAMQKLFVYVTIAFNNSEAYLKLFGKSEYQKSRASQLKMKELLEKANRQANITANKAPLLAVGYTQAAIDNLATIMNAIDSLNAQQEDAKSNRLKTTEDRIKANNKVWSYMVKISEASKVVYVDSPAKIQEYLLYPGTLNMPHKVQNLTYFIPTHIANWDPAINSDSYQLEYKSSTPAGPILIWMLAYSGVESETIFNPGIGGWVFRARGVNDNGYGDWSDEFEVVI